MISYQLMGDFSGKSQFSISFTSDLSQNAFGLKFIFFKTFSYCTTWEKDLY